MPDTKNSSYNYLCTEFYNIDKPEAGPKEVEYYSSILENISGPIIEAMCGSGRLLIPLLKRKRRINVEGVDNSSAMLESCQERCKKDNLQPQLYQQSLLDLQLPKQYSLIFIALGSFQLFDNRSEALQVLKNLHNQLLPGGTLLLETYIPWNLIKMMISDDMLLDNNVVKSCRSVMQDDVEIVYTNTTTIDVYNQIESSEALYEKKVNNEIVATEYEKLSVRWYYKYEMELFLEKAGFSHIETTQQSFELNPQAIMYRATR